MTICDEPFALCRIMFFFLKSNLVLIVVILAVAAGSGYWLWGKGGEEQKEEIVSVMRGTITQEVSVTGRVKPVESVALAFERSGRVASVLVDVGNRVSVGQVLAVLANADLAASLADAKANMKKEEAKLAELKRGTRPEEIAVQEVKVREAKQALLDAIQDAYRKADDAIRNKIDQFMDNPRTASPRVTVTVPDGALRASFENGRVLREISLVSWASALTVLSVADDLSAEALRARTELSAIRSFLDSATLLLASAVPSSSISQSTINGHRTDITTARTNVNAAIDNLASAESDLAVKTSELALKRAGTPQEQITAQEAALEQAAAKTASAEAELAKTKIISPIRGIVTEKNAQTGEIVSVNTLIISVISGAFSAQGGPAFGWEIEANIPEADIAKIKTGNKARVTLDAYGSDVIFGAAVTRIDPAETIVDGVATYRVEFQFDAEDVRIKSGMTANMDIETAKKEGALLLPQRAVIRKNGDATVRIREAGVVREIPVKTGIRGTDGNIEILEGLNEGDAIAVSLSL